MAAQNFLAMLHGVSVLFIVLELMMLSVQLYFYLIWPRERRRLNYLVLLVLLILYNAAGGLFVDERICWASVQLQQILLVGSGLMVPVYFPWYFFKSFGLFSLRFHALYGVWLFLVLPYLVFFALVYPLTDELAFAVRWGMALPALYCPVLLFVVFRAVYGRRDFTSSMDSYRRLQMRAVCWAVSPWLLFPVFVYLQVEWWLEALVMNGGFVVIAFLFLMGSSKRERRERMRLLVREAQAERDRNDFLENCRSGGLTARETEVAELLCGGWTYKRIGEGLFISEKTVDNHVQRIFLKVGVGGKIELQKALGYKPR